MDIAIRNAKFIAALIMMVVTLWIAVNTFGLVLFGDGFGVFMAVNTIFWSAAAFKVKI